jgi:hypothetical protein
MAPKGTSNEHRLREGKERGKYSSCLESNWQEERIGLIDCMQVTLNLRQGKNKEGGLGENEWILIVSKRNLQVKTQEFFGVAVCVHVGRERKTERKRKFFLMTEK